MQQLERRLLCSMLLSGRLIKTLIRIEPDHFTDRKHQLIYRGMLEISKREEPIDLVSVAKELRRSRKYKEAGGSAYLTSLFDER